jgi:hypothetical protein
MTKTEIIQKESDFDQIELCYIDKHKAKKKNKRKTSFEIRLNHVQLQDKETDKEMFKSDHVQLLEKETETQEEKF